MRLRRAATIALAWGVALATLGPPALAPVLAATPGLTITAATTYDARPAEGRVVVTSTLTATNHLKDTVTKRFFFRTAVVTVLPGTSGFKLGVGSGKPKVSVAKRTSTYTNLKLDLGANLAAGRTTTLTLTFDLKDPGGPPDRTVRISPSLISFAAWAIATPNTPGSSVTVLLPTGYSATIGQGPMTGPVADGAGHDVFSTGPLSTPTTFIADVVADRPTDYVETSHQVPLAAGPATVLVRAWPDDAAWGARVAGLVTKALPLLEREIGVPWPLTGPLAIREAVARSIGGNAGVFDPSTSEIQLAYAAPDGVIVHELAHAWFDGRLVADRWAAEGFASYYAEVVSRQLGIDPAAPVPPTGPGSWAIPLNAWGPAGSAPPETEAWASAASLDLARSIAERAGADALRAVWSSAVADVGAYQPEPGGTEPAAGPPDWRGLLDLLEDGTGRSFGDLWLQWVARPADVQALADRAVARGLYLRSIALAGGWQLPPVDRAAMRAWRFDVAKQLLADTDAVSAQRVALEAAAAAAHLALPVRLRAAFEGDGGIAAAAAEATAERAVVDAIGAARAAKPTETAGAEREIIAIGLIGAHPEADVDGAVQDLAAGDVQHAYALAAGAATAWNTAAPVGRSRIVSVLLLLVALGLVIGFVRQRRRQGVAAPT